MADVDHGASRLVARLERTAALTAEERQAVLALPIRDLALRADQDIAREGDRPARCFLLLEGFACTFKRAGDGRRQILAVHVPGDVPDLQSLHLKVLDNSIGALSPCRVGFVYHDDLRALCARHPRVQAALWRATLVEAAVARQWMLNLGRRNAYARLAHLLCEILQRLEAVGLARDHACELPLTQVELGELLGLSAVHVNRTVQQLRAAGLVALRGRRFQALDWPGLKRAGAFDPAYLYLG